VAVIVALSAWPDAASPFGEVAHLRVPLASAIDLPGRTEPSARMSIKIAGLEYGPTTVGRDGRFSLPVVVPPGHRYGEGLAVDRLGNRRATKVDLLLPPTNPLACVMNPVRLPRTGV